MHLRPPDRAISDLLIEAICKAATHNYQFHMSANVHLCGVHLACMQLLLLSYSYSKGKQHLYISLKGDSQPFQ